MKATLQEIDWEALELSLDSKPAMVRTNICKYIHGWQNVGLQKIRMDEHTRRKNAPLDAMK